MTAAVRADTGQHLAVLPIPLHVLAPLLVHIGREYQDGLGVLFEDLARAWQLADGADYRRTMAGVSYDTAVRKYEVALDAVTSTLAGDGVRVEWELPADEARSLGARIEVAGLEAAGNVECAGGCGAWVHRLDAVNGFCSADCEANALERQGSRS
jgi:hypothetical protein